MQNNASFLGMIEQPCMISRLTDELREASREFREDPMAFVTTALKRDAVGSRRKMLLQVGLAIAILFYAIAFATMLVFWSLAQQRAQGSPSGKSRTIALTLPGYWPKTEMPSGDDKHGGGGGGGLQANTPPSIGEIPISSLAQLVMAPNPEPQLTPPALPVIEKVMVDPRIQFKHDDLSPTGLPDGIGLTHSAGQGSDKGIGTGAGGGVGSGDGPGVGPGSGGNTGGDSFKVGGARPRPAVLQSVVDERPVLLNRPRPMFTEEARRNKIQGVVRMKILIDVSGKVTQVVVTRGLPDGLDLEAIRAAYQMRFRPAMKSGSPVSFWLSNVEVEFNLR
jgi:TonB family protein